MKSNRAFWLSWLLALLVALGLSGHLVPVFTIWQTSGKSEALRFSGNFLTLLFAAVTHLYGYILHHYSQHCDLSLYEEKAGKLGGNIVCGLVAFWLMFVLHYAFVLAQNDDPSSFNAMSVTFLGRCCFIVSVLVIIWQWRTMTYKVVPALARREHAHMLCGND